MQPTESEIVYRGQKELRRVARISVDNLFGVYYHDIRLNLDHRITIIHGPNGVGKTVLLRLVSNFFRGRYLFLARVPYDCFQVSLDDGSSASVRQLPAATANTLGSERQTLQIDIVSQSGTKFETFQIDVESELLRTAQRLEQMSPYIRRVDDATWIDDRVQARLSARELVDLYNDENEDEAPLPGPEWVEEFRNSVSVHLIETQRLLMLSAQPAATRFALHNQQSVSVPTVRRYAAQLQRNISSTLRQYAAISQRLDQTFPQRLLSGPPTLDIDRLKEKMRSLDQNRSKLAQIGLVQENQPGLFNFENVETLDNTQTNVMTLYVNDTEQKLAALDAISHRVSLLLDIVNKKFRHKRIMASPEHGLVAIGQDDNALDLSSLSSGEQHELVLAYDLLFRVRRNSLVMIDEPELSLHVTWQRAFLPDLINIVKASEFDVLLATHSQIIAGESPELMIALTDPAPEE